MSGVFFIHLNGESVPFVAETQREIEALKACKNKVAPDAPVHIEAFASGSLTRTYVIVNNKKVGHGWYDVATWLQLSQMLQKHLVAFVIDGIRLVSHKVPWLRSFVKKATGSSFAEIEIKHTLGTFSEVLLDRRKVAVPLGLQQSLFEKLVSEFVAVYRIRAGPRSTVVPAQVRIIKHWQMVLRAESLLITPDAVIAGARSIERSPHDLRWAIIDQILAAEPLICHEPSLSPEPVSVPPPQPPLAESQSIPSLEAQSPLAQTESIPPLEAETELLPVLEKHKTKPKMRRPSPPPPIRSQRLRRPPKKLTE